MPRLAPRIPGLTRWLTRGQRGLSEPADQNTPPEDPLLAVGRRLRQEREARGLNLRQLALETRISTPVLEALERGWRDRLPEGAYLRTMLPLIEQRLELPSGSLDAALPAISPKAGAGGAGKPGLLPRFTPGSIDVFSTWQGTLIYGALSLGLIYAINLQQQQIAAAALLSVKPIPALPPSEQRQPASPAVGLLNAYPDLRPLLRASRGQALSALKSGSSTDTGVGILHLTLTQPSSVSLNSDSGERSAFKAVQGELVLQLKPPLQLTVTPAPKATDVTWNGEPLAPLAKQPGQFRLPQPLNARNAEPTPPTPAAAP